MIVDGKIPVDPQRPPVPKADLIRDQFGFVED